MSRIDRLLFLIFRDRSRREQAFAAYIHHKNLYSKGNGEISFWVGMANIDTFLLLSIFVKTNFPWIPLWTYFALFPILIIARTGVAWFIGWWWDKNKLFDTENSWTNRRNPVLNGLDKKILQPGLKR